MADPHIKSPMDGWDYTTVIIYRLGFVFAVPMLFMCCLGILQQHTLVCLSQRPYVPLACIYI